MSRVFVYNARRMQQCTFDAPLVTCCCPNAKLLSSGHRTECALHQTHMMVMRLPGSFDVKVCRRMVRHFTATPVLCTMFATVAVATYRAVCTLQLRRISTLHITTSIFQLWKTTSKPPISMKLNPVNPFISHVPASGQLVTNSITIA